MSVDAVRPARCCPGSSATRRPRRYFAAEAELREMILFEEALALAEAEAGVIPRRPAAFIADQISTFEPDIAAIRNAAARDGVIGVEFVRQLRDWVGAPHGAHVHFGATSQDLVDTALVRRLRPLLAVFEQRIEQVLAALDHLEQRFGDNEIMGRTRMQDALPIRVGGPHRAPGGSRCGAI